MLTKIDVSGLSRDEIKNLKELVSQKNQQLMRLLQCTHSTPSGQLSTITTKEGDVVCRHCGKVLDIRLSSITKTPKSEFKLHREDMKRAKNAKRVIVSKNDNECHSTIEVKIPRKMYDLLMERYKPEELIDLVESMLIDARSLTVPKWVEIISGRIHGLDRNVTYVNLTLLVSSKFKESIKRLATETQVSNWTVRVLWALLKEDQAVINDLWLNGQTFSYAVSNSYHYRDVTKYRNISLDEWVDKYTKSSLAPKRLVNNSKRKVVANANC